jgi:hypothetical protein
MCASENIGALCHEVNTAEKNVLSAGVLGCRLCKFERVAGDICELNDLISLIVMTQDHCSIAERLTRSSGTRDQLGVASRWKFSGA